MASDENEIGERDHIKQADRFLYYNSPNATDLITENLSMFNQSENQRLFHKTLDDLLYSTQQMIKNNKQVDFIIRDLSVSSSYNPEENISSSSIINNAIICDTKIVDRIKQRIIDTIASTGEDFDKTCRENFPSIVKDFVRDVSLRHADYADNIIPKPAICNPQCVGTGNLILNEIIKIFDALTSAKREKTDSSSRVTLAEDKMEEKILEKAKSIICMQEKPSTVMMEAVRSTTIIIQRKNFVDSQVSVSSIHFVQESQYPLAYLDVTDELRETARIQVSSLIKEPSRDGIAHKVSSSISLKSEKRDFQDAAVITGLTAITVKREKVEEEERRKDSTIFLRSILDTVTFAVFQHIAIISTKNAKVVKDKKDEEEKDVQVVKVPKVAKVDRKKKEEKDVKFAINDGKEEEEQYIEVVKNDIKEEEEKYIEVVKNDIKEEEEKYIEAAKDDIKEEEEEYIEVAKDDIKKEEKEYIEVAKKDIKEEKEEYIEVAKDDIKEEEKKYIEVAKDDIKEEEEEYIEVAKDDIKEEEEKYIEVAKDDIKEKEEKYIEVAKDDIKEEEEKYIEVAKDDIKEEEEEYIEVAKDDIKEEEEKYIEVIKDDIKEKEEEYIKVAKDDIKEEEDAHIDTTIETIETTVDSSIIDIAHKMREDNNKIVSLKYKKPKYLSIDSLDLSHISETLIKHDYFITKKEKMPLCKKIRHPSVSTCTFFSCTSFEPTRKFCCEKPAAKICLDDRSSLPRILQPISCCLIPSNTYLGKYCDIRTISFDPQIAATQETTLSNVLHPSLQNSRTIGYQVSCRALTNNKYAFLRHYNINCCRKHRAIFENSSYATYDTRCKFGVKYYCPRLNNIGNIQTSYYHCNNNCPIWNTRHCERNQLHHWSRGNLYFIHPWTSRSSLRYY